MNKLTTTGPSFVMGYWRPWKENSNAFDSFLDYSKDLGLANYTASAVGTYIQEAASQQVDAINNLAYEIGYGMDVLSSQMEDVSGQLRFLNRNMDIQVEQQKLSNLLLQNIAELLRVPDSEKERQLCIEMGVKFLVNAQKDSDLYDDALEELHKAEELRKQDYFVLHRLGTIYLYTEKHMNPEKALDYFLLAAKYASVESDPEAMRLANVMTQSFDTVNSGDSTESIQHLAGDSYKKAAFTCYVLGRFEEAEKNQQKALKLHPSPENKFLLAKYAVRSGNIDAGVKQLSEAIDESPELMGGVFKELDLANEKAVLEMVKKKNEDIDSEIDKFIETIINETNQKSSPFTESIKELKSKSFGIKGGEIASIIKNIEMFKFQKLNYWEKKEVMEMPYKEFIDKVEKLRTKLGDQTWSSKNLNVDTFRNGDPIPHAETEEQWIQAGRNGTPAWCYYDNDPANGEMYGKLYNWHAVNDPRGLAPEGWHVPSYDEWTTLADHLGGKDIAGTKMKSTSGWEEDGNGTNESGFAGLPGGSCSQFGTFYKVGGYGVWWSSSEHNNTAFAWYRSLSYDNGNVRRDRSFKGLGLSVRCLRD